MDDERLMILVACGDATAFEMLVKRHQARLIRFAASILADGDAAQDAVQDALLSLWRHRAQYYNTGKPVTYLLRIVRNACFDQQRKQRPNLPIDKADRQTMATASGPEQAMQSVALSDAIQSALLQLPEAQRAVFALSEYEKLSYQEIAIVMNCPVGTVASRKRLAMEALRRELKSWNEGDLL